LIGSFHGFLIRAGAARPGSFRGPCLIGLRFGFRLGFRVKDPEQRTKDRARAVHR